MSDDHGAVAGGPRMVLRLEGLAVLALAVAWYARSGNSWWLFAALFLAPDLALLGYLMNARVGAVAYNVLHTYLGPALIVAVCRGAGLGTAVALIWAAHIGLDRALGIGLKYARGFRATHLGSVGTGRAPTGTG